MFIKIVQLVFLGATHLPFLFPLFPPIFRQMNDTWKQTDPMIKKKEVSLEKYNNGLPASSFSLWLSSHYAIEQHHNAKLEM